MAGRLSISMRSCALAVVIPALLTGCRGKAPVPAVDTYTARGVVEKLPLADGRDRDLYIHHAPIPSFRDEHGQVVGMMSMTMPFPLASGVSLAGIRPGDPVEFTFTVSWRKPIGHRLMRIDKLPAGTVIDFESHH